MRVPKYISCWLFSLLFILGCSKPHSFPEGRWIDLSHEFSSQTLYWPTAETFKHDTVFAGVTDKSFYYQAFNFSAAEHGGTHIDAPIHFAKDGRTVDQIPLDQLIGPAAVIDISGEALGNQDYQVRRADFTAWESDHGEIPDKSIVFLKTGYGQYWPKAMKYMGTDKRGSDAVAELHFPGLHPDAARWLVENRRIGAIGIDTPSIDFGQSELFESHQILFEQNIPAFENVANLDQLPTTGALVVALPMKIRGGSGGPLRLAALVPSS